MKKPSSKSWTTLALMLLIASCGGAYALTYNALRAAGASVGLPIALLMLLAIGSGLIMFVGHVKSQEAMGQLQHSANQMREQLDDIYYAKQREQTTAKVNAKMHDNTEQQVGQLLPPPNSSRERMAEQLLTNIAHQFDIAQGTFHLLDPESGLFQFCAGYAYYSTEQPISYALGETLPGQVAKSQQPLRIDKLPEGYACIKSGLGQSTPTNLLITPVVDAQGSTIGIIELSSFNPLPSERLFGELGRRFGQQLNLASAEPHDTQQ